jgi:hypothetical protein
MVRILAMVSFSVNVGFSVHDAAAMFPIDSARRGYIEVRTPEEHAMPASAQSQTLSARIYFFITRQGSRWNVAVDHNAPVSFGDRDSAIQAAMAGARKIWEDFHHVTGVRIQDDHGDWRALRTFGA